MHQTYSAYFPNLTTPPFSAMRQRIDLFRSRRLHARPSIYRLLHSPFQPYQAVWAVANFLFGESFASLFNIGALFIWAEIFKICVFHISETCSQYIKSTDMMDMADSLILDISLCWLAGFLPLVRSCSCFVSGLVTPSLIYPSP